MGHFKEIETGCINMENIEKGSERVEFLYILKCLMTTFQISCTDIGRYSQLFATIRNPSPLFTAFRRYSPLSRLGKAPVS